MKNPFSRKKNLLEKIDDLTHPEQRKKEKKLIQTLQHALLWFSLFMAGFIVAKLHTLLT